MSDAMRSLYDQLETAKRARLDAAVSGDAAAVLAARAEIGRITAAIRAQAMEEASHERD